MPIAHTCASCGTSLTRLRAGVDPRLGLQVIVCPACSTPAVRSRDPLLQLARTVFRLLLAFRIAFVYLFVSALLVGVTIGIAGALLDVAAHRPLPDVAAAIVGLAPDPPLLGAFRDEGGFAWLGAAVLAALVTGAWLAAALPHQPRWVPVALHVAALVIIPTFIVFSVSVADMLNAGHPNVPAFWSVFRAQGSLVRTPGFWMVPLLAFTPIPLGWLLARSVQRRSADPALRRFSRLRARARKARSRS